jgi:DNA-binding NarL/FixJ family response regulator
MTMTNEITSAPEKFTVLIVDDHPIVRQGLAQLISHEPDITICGGAETVSDAIEQIARIQPDLVLIDISLRDSNGLDLLSQIRSVSENARTLVWSMFDESVYAERALRAGAMGYVNKQEPVETVIEAVRQVLRGNVYLSNKLAAHLVRRVGGVAPVAESPISPLSNRELEVFTMIGRGLTTNEIANRLNLSSKTVETHRERIKLKLNLRNACELSRRAVLWVLENG